MYVCSGDPITEKNPMKCPQTEAQPVAQKPRHRKKSNGYYLCGISGTTLSKSASVRQPK